MKTQNSDTMKLTLFAVVIALLAVAPSAGLEVQDSTQSLRAQQHESATLGGPQAIVIRRARKRRAAAAASKAASNARYGAIDYLHRSEA